jgi:hypothetical protein
MPNSKEITHLDDHKLRIILHEHKARLLVSISIAFPSHYCPLGFQDLQCKHQEQLQQHFSFSEGTIHSQSICLY